MAAVGGGGGGGRNAKGRQVRFIWVDVTGWYNHTQEGS